MIYENTDREMALLVKETDMLPRYTPIFLSDIAGRILNARNLKAEKDDFLSVARMISQSECEKYLSQREQNDCLVMHMKSNPKDLLVLTKNDGDVLHGVICSYSEKNCIKLDEYYEKLLSYRDYLDSLTRISLVPQLHMPAIKLFEVRMGGVSQLLRFSSVSFRAHEYMDVPLSMLMEKVAGFVKNVSENSAMRISIDCDRDKSANIPVCFINLLVSCISLAVRHSRDAYVRMGTKNTDDGYTIIVVETDIMHTDEKSDVYESALSGAFINMGVGFEILKRDGLYSIHMRLETKEIKKEVLAEADEITRMLSRVLLETDVSDLVYTIIS